MHNGRLADESDPLTVARKAAQVEYKKNPTSDNWEAFATAMMRGAAYFDDSIGLYMPEDNLRSMLTKAAASVQKKGQKTYKSAASTLSFDSDGLGFPFLIDGKPVLSLDAFCKNKRFRFERIVTINKSKVRSVRPLIPRGWTCDLRFDYRPDILEESTILAIFDIAGLEIGLGDWRPSSPKPGPFGQFMVSKVNGKEV